jgi:hypothetical protein
MFVGRYLLVFSCFVAASYAFKKHDDNHRPPPYTIDRNSFPDEMIKTFRPPRVSYCLKESGADDACTEHMKITFSKISEEDELSPFFSPHLMCTACKAVAFQGLKSPK